MEVLSTVSPELNVTDSTRCFIFLFLESNGDIVVTQTPLSFQANPGDRVVLQCKASTSVSSYMALYQFKDGQKPKLLIYGGSNRFEGTPDRFSGSGSGTDFSFTINNVRPEDEAEYYCGQYNSFPLTVIHISTKTRLMGWNST